MNEYIEKLKSLFEKSHYGEEYKRKCIEYAERLLSNELPVIYDLEHLTMVLGIKKKILTKMIFIRIFIVLYKYLRNLVVLENYRFHQ